MSFPIIWTGKFDCGNAYTAVTMPHGNLGAGFAYNGTVYVVTPRLGTNGRPAYSSDGITWTTATLTGSPFLGSWEGLVWTGSKFIANASGFTYEMESTDGINWTITNTVSNSETMVNRCAMIWSTNAIIRRSVTAGKFISSTDGITYTLRSLMPSADDFDVFATDGSTIVSVTGSNAGANNKAAYQTVANQLVSTWTAATLPSSQVWEYVIHNGHCYFAMSSQVGYTGGARSYDGGATWEAVTVPSVPRGLPVVRANGAIQFADSTSDSQTGYCSVDDGATWTSFALPSSLQPFTWSGGSTLTDKMFAFTYNSGGDATDAARST